MEGICKSNKITIQLMEQKQKKITIELRNLQKANNILVKNIKRIQKMTSNSNSYPSR